MDRFSPSPGEALAAKVSQDLMAEAVEKGARQFGLSPATVLMGIMQASIASMATVDHKSVMDMVRAYLACCEAQGEVTAYNAAIQQFLIACDSWIASVRVVLQDQSAEAEFPAPQGRA